MDNKLFLPTQKQRCVKYLSFVLSAFFPGESSWLVRNIRSGLRQLAVRVRLAVHAGLLAASTNKRVYTGLVLILIVAPLSGVTYQLFDITSIDYSWYYRTYYDFFLVLGPYFCICVCLIGATLLLPQGSKASYFLLFPLALYIGKILWMCAAETNDEFNAFWQIIPYYFFVTGAIIALLISFTFKWLMSLHFHKRAVIVARILSLIDCPGFEDRERLRIQREEKQRLNALK